MSVQIVKSRISGTHDICVKKEDELIAIQESMNRLVDRIPSEASPIHNLHRDSVTFMDLANQETRILYDLAKARRACSACSEYQFLLDSDPRFDR